MSADKKEHFTRSLPGRKEQIRHHRHNSVGASLCTRLREKSALRAVFGGKKASYTLEAAVVLPLAAIFLAFFLWLFGVIQAEYEVQDALILAGRQTAANQTAAEEQSRLFSEARAYFSQNLSEKQANHLIDGGTPELFLSLREEEDAGIYICLQADYVLSFPFAVFGGGGISLSAKSEQALWTGRSYADGSFDDPIVYYTPSGSVYHTTLSCSYLSLSISVHAADELPDLRNQSGGRYSACKSCAGEKPTQGVIYVTDYGTSYHTTLDCPALTRTIYTARLSQVTDRRACSRCGF